MTNRKPALTIVNGEVTLPAFLMENQELPSHYSSSTSGAESAQATPKELKSEEISKDRTIIAVQLETDKEPVSISMNAVQLDHFATSLEGLEHQLIDPIAGVAAGGPEQIRFHIVWDQRCERYDQQRPEPREHMRSTASTRKPYVGGSAMRCQASPGSRTMSDTNRESGGTDPGAVFE